MGSPAEAEVEGVSDPIKGTQAILPKSANAAVFIKIYPGYH